jgi:hypothetical protein
LQPENETAVVTQQEANLRVSTVVMESGALPSINRASSGDNAPFYSGTTRSNTPGPTAKADYDYKMDKLAAMYFPGIDPEASVKSRLNNLEETVHAQANHNKQNHQTIGALSRHLEDVDSNLKGIILSMQTDFDTRLSQLKKEYDHRFDLQASENKRLQSHVASLKSDTNQLKRKMVSGTIVVYFVQ